MGMMVTSPHLMEDPSHQIHVENNKDPKDASSLEDLLGSLTKAPTLNIPESLADLLMCVRPPEDAMNLALREISRFK